MDNPAACPLAGLRCREVPTVGKERRPPVGGFARSEDSQLQWEFRPPQTLSGGLRYWPG